MNNEELLEELESLVDAMSQSLAVISGSIAEAYPADVVLKSMLAAKGAIEDRHGENAWRDRLLRDMLRIVALKARPAAAGDAELQGLISSVLESPVGRSQKH